MAVTGSTWLLQGLHVAVVGSTWLLYRSTCDCYRVYVAVTGSVLLL